MSAKPFLWDIFGKSQIPSTYIFETNQRRHRINIFFETCLRRLKDVTWKTCFLRFIWDVLKRSQKVYLFCDVFKTSWRGHKKHIFFEMYLRYLKEVTKRTCFEMYLRRLKEVTKKASFLRCIRNLLKTSQKRRLLRCFWEVFEMSVSMEIWLRHLKDISCRLGFWNKCGIS